MAIRGRKPTRVALRLITGSHLSDRPPPKEEPSRAGAVERPAKMSKGASRLWDLWIARAYWLTWPDSPKALLWCYLQAEFERAPGTMLSSRIAQLRALGSELGFDQAARTRMGVMGDPATDSSPRGDLADKYFSDPADRDRK